MPTVRDACFGGEVLQELEDARRRARHWCLEEYGMRRHSSTRRYPLEHFEALYSLRRQYVGTVPRARADCSTVRFYEGSVLVKTHPRMLPGRRSTDPGRHC